MKKNNKGFMLVEVIIVTVIVATIMTSLYVAFVRVYKVYDIKDKYSNVDGIYALNMIMDYYVDNITINNIRKIAQIILIIVNIFSIGFKIFFVFSFMIIPYILNLDLKNL